MDKSYLFDLLRKEKFVLWAGAGFSLYAGYPSGGAIASFLNEGLAILGELKIKWSFGIMIIGTI